MGRYIVLLPGDEDAWEAATPQQRAEGYAAHERFAAALTERGHQIRGGAELAHSRTARSIRRQPDGSTVVTDGPFAETVEQLTGFYDIESDDLHDLVAICRELVGAGESIELRPVASQEVPS